ncbi:MAG TPA: hypothetical protein DHW82_09905 [Spirochaetia bacterium]|nr:hypothetical protein [Spirochaetia bacterium]
MNLETLHPQIASLVLYFMNLNHEAKRFLEKTFHQSLSFSALLLSKLAQTSFNRIEPEAKLIIEKIYPKTDWSKTQKTGLEAALEILCVLEPYVKHTILDQIEIDFPDTFLRLRPRLFLFDDLLKIKPSVLFQFFQSIQSKKTVSDAFLGYVFQDRVFQRIFEIIKDLPCSSILKTRVELEIMPNLKVSQKFKAQEKILKTWKYFIPYTQD